MLTEKLTGIIEVLDIRSNPLVDLTKYDIIIIGGPITAGKINSVVKRFCENNMDLLL